MRWIFTRPWIVHILALLPLAWLVTAYLTANLTADPVQTGLQRTGKTALILLLVTLALTPLKNVLSIPELIRLRRPLGLYSFFYAALHALIYIVVDYELNLPLVWQNLVVSTQLVAGSSAFVILGLLAVTSIPWWAHNLAKKWKLLHRLIYVGGILAVLHYAMAGKDEFLRWNGSFTEAQLYAVLLALLLLLRLPIIHRQNELGDPHKI